MRIAISIPTYRAHLKHNFEFLRSVTEHRTEDEIPEILFTTSDESERDELDAFRRTLPAPVRDRVRVESLHRELAVVTAPDFASDFDSGFAYGIIGFITYKKFLGVRRAFARGFDHVVILDSEVIQFRRGSLARSLSLEVGRGEYRSSVAAYREPWATKVHHDSLRSVVGSYDNTEIFARSYGWYDGLCTFERTDFDGFIAFLAGAGEGDEILRATHKFRGFGFDWIAYQVWRHYVAKRSFRMVDLDQRLRSVELKLRPKPQTENLFLYFTADMARNAAIVRALDPPWVPFTRNAHYVEAIKAGTPDTCCLMFHADRHHAGAAPLPSFRRRTMRWLEPYLRRLAKALLGLNNG